MQEWGERKRKYRKRIEEEAAKRLGRKQGGGGKVSDKEERERILFTHMHHKRVFSGTPSSH